LKLLRREDMRFLHQRLIAALKPRFLPRLVSPLVGAVLLGGFLVSGASATSTPTTYYACVNFTSGTIYMIQGDGQCKSSEYTKISWNQTGPAGPPGPQGPQGPAGPTQTASIQTVVSPVQNIPAMGGQDAAQAVCPTGTVLTGGGFVILASPPTGWSIAFSTTNVAGTGWFVGVENFGTSSLSFDVVARCFTLS
jgi:hypothetical protein